MVLVATILCGCTTVEYYAPMESDEYSVTYTYGPREQVVISPVENITIRLRVVGEPDPMIQVMFDLPEGHRLKFMGGVFQLTEDSGQSLAGTIDTIKANHIVNGVGELMEFSPQDELPGATYKVYDRLEIPRHYDFIVPIDREPYSGFALKIPDFELDEITYSFSPITFTKRTGRFYLYQPW